MDKSQSGDQKPLFDICQKLLGKWVQESAENLDAYMKALDVNILKRTVGDNTKMEEDWSIKNDVVCVKIQNPFKSTTTKFRLNEMVEEETMDGQEVNSVYTEEENMLITRQERKPHNVILSRQIKPYGRMLLTMTLESSPPVVARITFMRNDSAK